MDYKKVKLIVADIDGTIRANFTKLTPRTIAAIDALKEKGIYFGIASGRSLKNVTGYAAEWGMSHQFDLCIAINGDQIYDNVDGSVFMERKMHSEDIKYIIDNMRPLGLGVSFFTDEEAQYILEMTDQLREAQKRNHYEYIVADPEFKIFDKIGVNKVMFRVPNGDMPKIEAYVEEHPFIGYSSFKTQPICYEVMPEGITKATAIRHFCEKHGINEDEVMTFGDTTNDNTMLEAYYGVAMKNATEDTKAIAQEITEYTAEEDGFARYLEDYILNR